MPVSSIFVVVVVVVVVASVAAVVTFSLSDVSPEGVTAELSELGTEAFAA